MKLKKNVKWNYEIVNINAIKTNIALNSINKLFVLECYK